MCESQRTDEHSRGTGPTALYVHGSGATHRVWGRQYAPSGPTHPAVALDLSGHGDADGLDSGTGTAALPPSRTSCCGGAGDRRGCAGRHFAGRGRRPWVALERDWTPEAIVLLGTGPELPVFDGLQEWLADDWDRAVEFLHDGTACSTTPATRPRLAPASDGGGRAGGNPPRLHDVSRFDVRERLGEIACPSWPSAANTTA